MDGLLALIIIGWILASLKKKSKKKTAANRAILENETQHRASHAAQLRAELEKRRIKQEAKPVQMEQLVMGEGESHGDAGSMLFDSDEGECICEPDLEHERETAPVPNSVYADEIGREPVVDFSAKGILQGVVMSEILTRPAQRARRMR